MKMEKPEILFEENGYTGIVYNPLPQRIQEKILNKSWNEKCPVPIDDLAYIQFTHWNFNEEKKTGEMIVHKKLSEELLEIFYELYLEKYPIQQAHLIEDYDVDDENSMSANNSSAFCSRENVTFPGQFSKHSYGIAIDINPKINPYYHFEKKKLQPEGSQKYLDRDLAEKGMIAPGDACYNAFIKRGFDWGGEKWPNRVDYHHFEKEIQDVL